MQLFSRSENTCSIIFADAVACEIESLDIVQTGVAMISNSVRLPSAISTASIKIGHLVPMNPPSIEIVGKVIDWVILISVSFGVNSVTFGTGVSAAVCACVARTVNDT